MAKRITSFFSSLRGSAETNLKNGKEEIAAQIQDFKGRMPSIKEGLNAVKSVPLKLPDEMVQNKVKELIRRYEKFTGVDEIMVLQKTVVEAQEKFIAAQEQRREAGHKLMSIQRRLKELHDEMQNTPKGDEKYLKLVTDEHKIIVEEQFLRKDFSVIEREEREQFSTMSAAVKLSHERERAHADRNKYWYIVASLIGTAFGVLGSTMNNRIKMAEFRDMLTEQMERSNNVLMTVSGGDKQLRNVQPGLYANSATTAAAAASSAQESAAKMQQLRDLETRVAALAHNQGTILEHIRHVDKSLDTQFRETKRLIVAATASSARSDKALQEAIAATSHILTEPIQDPTILQRIGWSNPENEEKVKMAVVVGLLAVFVLGVISKLN